MARWPVRSRRQDTPARPFTFLSRFPRLRDGSLSIPSFVPGGGDVNRPPLSLLSSRTLLTERGPSSDRRLVAQARADRLEVFLH